MARKSEASSNPIRQLRLQNGKTLEQFAHECGIHLQAVYLNEMGMYPSILPAIAIRMKVHYGLSSQEIEEDYSSYVRERRYYFGDRHIPYVLGDATSAISSVRLFRGNCGYKTAFGFAKAICINPTLIRDVESAKVENFPGQLNLALRDIQMSPEDIEELQYRHQEYYGRNRLRPRRTG
jgi:transcriptional regulator with XRE-family HTH domain